MLGIKADAVMGDEMSTCASGHTNDEGAKYCQQCGLVLDVQAVAIDRNFNVAVSLEPPTHTRVSVFFRLFLSIIPSIMSAFLGIVAVFATIASWFSALITGKVPEGIHRFVARTLDYQTRATAYSLLVTANYPGASLTPRANNEITTSVANGPLNRWAVFWRIFLALPAALLTGAGYVGLLLLAMVTWSVALFTTRAPRTLHQASASLIRLQSRYTAYCLLLTPEQPWHGLYGDAQDVSPEDAEQPGAQGAQWRFVKGTRRAITIFLILGGLLYVGLNIGIQAIAMHLPQYDYFCMDEMGNITSKVSLSPMNCPDGSDLFKMRINGNGWVGYAPLSDADL